MDVRLPDGRVVTNVPDGTTRSELMRRLAKADQPSQVQGYQGTAGDEPGKVDTLKDVRDAVADSPMLRPIALGMRQVGEGAASLASLPVDLASRVFNAGYTAGEPAGTQGPIPSTSQALTNLGAPVESTHGEQFGGAITRGATGAMSGAGAAERLASTATGTTQAVSAKMAARPGLQTVSGATGGAAAGAEQQLRVLSDGLQKLGIPQEWADKMGEIFAGLTGAVAPAVVESGLSVATRQAYRGGEQGRQLVEQNIDDFAKAGTTPTVAQATQGRVAQGGESLLSRTPGSAGRMVDKAATQADEIQTAVGKQADTLAPVSGADEAGLAISKGVRGSGGFVETFKAKQNQLYSELDNRIPGQTPVTVANTKQALEALNADIAGAPALSEWFKNARIKGIQGALDEDLATAAKTGIPDALPYEAIKKLRTLVGNELADSGLSSDVPRSKWKTLYAALSSDLEGAAKNHGPDATQAWSRATNYTRAGMQRLDVIESAIERAGGPEAIYKAATSGTKDGATVLRATMQSLPKDAQKVVSATVLRRLGTAKAGVQNATGDNFSTETYLTNWNNLSPAAKRTLFDRYGAGFRSDLDTVAKVTANIREGSKVFRNPSGTEQATAQASAVTGSVVALVTGRLDVLAAIGAGVATANLSSRLMTNPNFVKWLAGTTKFPAGAYAAQINVLANIAKTKDDPELAEAARLLQQEQQGKKRQQQNRGKNQEQPANGVLEIVPR